MAHPRYDGLAGWYEDSRPSLTPDEAHALDQLLGPGSGRCLDVGCGTGVAAEVVAALGWSVVGVDISGDLLAAARGRGLEVLQSSASTLPFPDASFDAAISVWTHTDIDDFPVVVKEVARVLRAGSPFVYVGAHPCFVGPHSLFLQAKGVPTLHPGYRDARRYDASAAGVNPDGLRAHVGGFHLPLGAFVGAFLGAGLMIERLDELGERDYPHVLAVRARSLQ